MGSQAVLTPRVRDKLRGGRAEAHMAPKASTLTFAYTSTTDIVQIADDLVASRRKSDMLNLRVLFYTTPSPYPLQPEISLQSLSPKSILSFALASCISW